MFSIVEMSLSFLYFITLVHYDSCCSFVCLFENDLSVVNSLCDTLFLGFDGLICASWILTLSK